MMMTITYLDSGGTICTAHGVNSKECVTQCRATGGTAGLPRAIKVLANRVATGRVDYLRRNG